MLRHPDYTRQRILQLTDRIQKLIYADSKPVDGLEFAGPVGRISYPQAQKLKGFRPLRLGQQFGPLWSTFWIRATAKIPVSWKGRRVELLFDSRSESTLWIDGRSIQGLNASQSIRPDAILLPRAKGGETLRFQLELACNDMFGSRIDPQHKSISPFLLERADVAAVDELAWDIYFDLRVLVDLESELARDGSATDKTWAGELLAELNRFANQFDPSDRDTWKRAHKILKLLYTRRNATQTHELSAIGHAHIDTAWLWPLAETDRKCERSFSAQTGYMDLYRDFRFACSQAYQYWRMKDRNPDLYQRIRARVKSGQFVPVGGTWIEPDCNIPSGEALIRQFLLGQRFFEREFGVRCKEFWNPDVFGYNGQLPQIMRLAGIRRFLTQKLSWNRFNRPEHHTFTWQGIDGSEVLAHFPPADTYNAMANVAELRKNMRDYKDHDRSRHSFMLFGYGDGGGGPTRTMIETLRRARDLQGLPRTQLRSSDEFFDLLERDCTDRPTIVGELYFELHRGTYTTQAATKRGNRKSELLLHDVEFLSALAGIKDNRFAYPSDELERLWQIVLLNQFHDILPGSSITLVYEDSKAHYQDVLASGQKLRDRAAQSLVGQAAGGSPTPINTIGLERAEVASTDDGLLVFVEAPSYGIGHITDARDRAKVKSSGRQFTLENAHLCATLNEDGQLVSLVEKHAKRESLAGACDLMIFEDWPTAWEAWDVDPSHLETGKPCEPAERSRITSRSPLRAEITFERRIGRKSRMKQVVRLDANARRLEFHCECDWQEDHKFLKAAFPVNVRAMNATYEMQFGVVERPTHFNTSFDLARYEVPGHRFADLSEHGFGVAILSESKYGYSTLGNTMFISLLRATTYPDPQADRGRQQFAYAIMPHAGGWRGGGVVAEAARFNAPIVFARSRATGPMSFASVEDSNLVLDTIKRAEDGDGLILRFYECHGARGTARVNLGFPLKKARYCNGLEDNLGPVTVANGGLHLPYAPFQIISVRVR